VKVYELLSRRTKRRDEAGRPDVYQYDNLPLEFRVQVIHIWVDAIGPWYPARPHSRYVRRFHASNALWQAIHDQLVREFGVFSLAKAHDNPCVQCRDYLQEADSKKALDTIDFTFSFIDRAVRQVRDEEWLRTDVKLTADEAIAQLNYRFREHGIGWQFQDGKLRRADSDYIHEEVVKEALWVLRHSSFRGPAQEFETAHQHYRAGRYEDAIANALKAFESTIKVVCDARGWPHDPNATASQLIKVVFDRGLVPAEMQSHFSGLRTTLEGGLPTVRNRQAAHGQGVLLRTVPDYLAAYALHLAAANIVLLAAAHEATQ